MPENHQLSERELEILRLVATGVSNKEIAHELAISVNTVKVHLRNIFSKLDVSSRTEATMWAVNNGVLETQANESIATELSEQLPARFRLTWRTVSIIGVLLVVVMMLIVSISLRNSQLPVTDGSQGQSVEQNRWQEHTPLPEPRKNFAATTYENEIVVIGGELDSGITASVWQYDPDQRIWQLSAGKPTPVTDIASVTLGGYIYVPGGRLADDQITNQFEVYDPRTDQWEQRAPLPVPVSAYSLVTFEGHLFVIGGWDGKNYLNTVFSYDPSLDFWSERSPMPTARAHAGAAVALGKIYVMGGYVGQEVLAVNEEYSPDLDDGFASPWMSKTPISEPCNRMGVTSIAEIVHVIGCENNNYRYYPQEDTWDPFSQIFVSTWSDFSLVSFGSKLFALGGKQDGSLSDINISYQAIYTVGIPALQTE